MRLVYIVGLASAVVLAAAHPTFAQRKLPFVQFNPDLPEQPNISGQRSQKVEEEPKPDVQPQTADAQPQATDAQPQATSDQAQPKPTLSAADRLIKQAFQKSKTAATVQDYTDIISLCQEGLDLGTGEESSAYAKRLQAWAYNHRGQKQSDAGDEKDAITDFDAAVTLDPRFWRALHNRAISKAQLGQLDAALADFDRTIQLNPEYANAWFNRAELKYGRGEFGNAISDYTRAIRLQSSDPGYYNSRGHAYYRTGRIREALSDYNRAVQINPEDAAARVNRGDAYRDQGIYGPAATDYREAIRINPTGRAYLSAAWLMATCPDQRYREAELGIDSAKKAIELDGDKDYRYLDTLAAAYANAGDFAQAKTTIAKALAAAPARERDRVRRRAQLYENGQAYREGGPPEPVQSASIAP